MFSELMISASWCLTIWLSPFSKLRHQAQNERYGYKEVIKMKTHLTILLEAATTFTDYTEGTREEM